MEAEGQTYRDRIQSADRNTPEQQVDQDRFRPYIEEELQQQKRWRIPFGGLIALFVGTLFLAVVAYWVLEQIFDSASAPPSKGDLFEGVSAIFSALALGGVIYTVFLQSKELMLQRQELRETREELKGQRLAAEQQANLIRTQRFENTFFSLLERLSSDVQALQADNLGHDFDGRKTFHLFYEHFRGAYLSVNENAVDKDSQDFLDQLYQKFYKEQESGLGHYFRLLYNIVKFVDNSSESDKKFYINILRAQLSSNELLLLFYNGLSAYGDKFKPLIEKYGLLENVPEEKLLNTGHKKQYAESAFGDQPKTQGTEASSTSTGN